MDTNNVYIIIKQNKIKRGYEGGMKMQWSEEEACPPQCLDVVRIHEGARREEGREGGKFWLSPTRHEKN